MNGKTVNRIGMAFVGLMSGLFYYGAYKSNQKLRDYELVTAEQKGYLEGIKVMLDSKEKKEKENA